MPNIASGKNVSCTIDSSERVLILATTHPTTVYLRQIRRAGIFIPIHEIGSDVRIHQFRRRIYPKFPTMAGARSWCGSGASVKAAVNMSVRAT
jgi:hypothetical protein